MQGRAAYSSRNFPQALICFEAAKKIRATDRAVNIHIARCNKFLRQPPEESWSGVWTMVDK